MECCVVVDWDAAAYVLSDCNHVSTADWRSACEALSDTAIGDRNCKITERSDEEVTISPSSTVCPPWGLTASGITSPLRSLLKSLEACNMPVDPDSTASKPSRTAASCSGDTHDVNNRPISVVITGCNASNQARGAAVGKGVVAAVAPAEDVLVVADGATTLEESVLAGMNGASDCSAASRDGMVRSVSTTAVLASAASPIVELVSSLLKCGRLSMARVLARVNRERMRAEYGSERSNGEDAPSEANRDGKMESDDEFPEIKTLSRPFCVYASINIRRAVRSSLRALGAAEALLRATLSPLLCVISDETGNPEEIPEFTSFFRKMSVYGATVATSADRADAASGSSQG